MKELKINGKIMYVLDNECKSSNYETVKEFISDNITPYTGTGSREVSSYRLKAIVENCGLYASNYDIKCAMAELGENHIIKKESKHVNWYITESLNFGNVEKRAKKSIS